MCEVRSNEDDLNRLKISDPLERRKKHLYTEDILKKRYSWKSVKKIKIFIEKQSSLTAVLCACRRVLLCVDVTKEF